jgi:hypothetical protein
VVKEKDAGKRIINLSKEVIDSKVLYKSLKDKIEDLGYTFLEKEQSKKETKYGDEIKFTFGAAKKYDDFAKAEIKIEVVLENLEKIDSGKFKGDGKITIEGKVFLDYKNEWTLSSYKKAIFDLYNKYFIGGRVKKMYVIPTSNDVEELNKLVKKILEGYYKY